MKKILLYKYSYLKKDIKVLTDQLEASLADEDNG